MSKRGRAPRHRGAAVALACGLAAAVVGAPCPMQGIRAHADELVLPNHALPRDHVATVVYRLSKPLTAPGVLAINWTDAVGDLVERRSIAVPAQRHRTDIRFTIDPRRSPEAANSLEAHLRSPGRDGRADASFVISPRPPDWSDYQLVIWQPQTAPAYRTLRTLGVTAAMVQVDRDRPALTGSDLQPLLEGGVRPYAENIATDFYSAYHRYFPDRPVNWRFVEAQALYRANPRDIRAVVRDPSLSDPVWQRKIRERLRQTVAAYHAYQPLFYDLADEAGIADLSAYWDFDFSPQSLAGMRVWLRSRYITLDALNRVWGTRFARWNAVIPENTAAAMRRVDGNYASWSDFKAWMDLAFTRAVAQGRDAIHAVDTKALVGIEGVQKPRWGGYDYELLTHSADVVEVDSVPQNLDLLRSLNPSLRILTTSGLNGMVDEHRVWRALLQGARGLVLWDEQHRLVTTDGTPGPLSNATGAYLREIRDGIGALLINSRPDVSPVAILYSPESLRVQWLLDMRGLGDAWVSRTSEDEWRDDGPVRGEMNAYRRALEELGVEPRYVSSAMIEQGVLADGTTRILVLPHVIALSAAEAREIRRFAARGGAIIADTEPGTFDSHGRRVNGLPDPAFSRIGPSTHIDIAAVPIPTESQTDDPSTYISDGASEALRAAIGNAGVKPKIALRDTSGAIPTDIARRRWHDGRTTILALQRDYSPQSPQTKSVTLLLPKVAYLYDVTRKTFLGQTRQVSLELDRAAPTILAVSPLPLPKPVLSLPRRTVRGQRIDLRVRVPSTDVSFHVLHVQVINPLGNEMMDYTSNVIARSAEVRKGFRLPLNAIPGRWEVIVVDVLSGQSASASFKIAGT